MVSVLDIGAAIGSEESMCDVVETVECCPLSADRSVSSGGVFALVLTIVAMVFTSAPWSCACNTLGICCCCCC